MKKFSENIFFLFFQKHFRNFEKYHLKENKGIVCLIIMRSNGGMFKRNKVQDLGIKTIIN